MQGFLLCGPKATTSDGAMLPVLEGSTTTAHGRRIAYSVAGPREGLPVFYLHGGIGSPIRCAPQLGELIERLHLRHVAVARPGFGGSDPQPGRRITDHAADVASVANALNISRFAVVGISSGGPYALAIARALPERVTATGVVSCLSPIGVPHQSRAMPAHVRAGLRALLRHPDRIERAAQAVVRPIARHREAAGLLALLGARGPDRREFADPASRGRAVTSFLEAAGGGVRGMLDDYAILCRPWGFDPTEVEGKVHVWHGAHDSFVPLEHARALASALPDCRLSIGTDDGHFFYRRRMARVLTTLITAARTSEAGCPAVRAALPLRLAA